jgi:hypothetical protein
MDQDEIQHLVWFIWSLRKKGDGPFAEKVLDLWRSIVTRLDTSDRRGRLMASQLCQWAVYVQRLGDSEMAILRRIVPFADESHHSSALLEALSTLSDEQPFEANEIWRAMLVQSTPDYPEEAVRRLLSNLVARGDGGKRAARDTVSEYLRRGSERPGQWLKEIIVAQAASR